jgi:hypothetical protein
VNTAYDGCNNGWNPDVSITSPAWDPASQNFAQSLSSVTPGFGQRSIPTLSSGDYPPVRSNAITNGQPDPTLQLPDFYDGFSIVPNGFANFNSFTQWDDLTTIDPQAAMTSFNQLPCPTTTNMPDAPVLPTQATGMFTTPTVPHPIARSVASHRSNANTNLHTCNYPGCGEILSRQGDLSRHRLKHGVPQHPCFFHGCNRRGPRAFYRADKLRDHQRKKHRMAI